jgi:multidrug transporter EmrE-like cation transporter
MDITTWLWSFSAALVSTIYFFLIKYYVSEKNPMIIVSVVALELLVIYLYYKSLEHSKSGIMYSIINGFSVMLGAMIAVFFFKEEITTQDIVGIAAIIFGIILVGKNKEVEIK